MEKTAEQAVVAGAQINAARFWGRIDRTAECWVWRGGHFSDGYGRVRVGGRDLKTHRIAWELTNGPIQDGLFVCHHCDNRGCCNPAHLFLGTAADNMHDRDAKGRSATGCRNGSRLHPESRPRGENMKTAKLTSGDVIRIRATYANGGITYKQLGQEYGVSATEIMRVVRGEYWRHIEREETANA